MSCQRPPEGYHNASGLGAAHEMVYASTPGNKITCPCCEGSGTHVTRWPGGGVVGSCCRTCGASGRLWRRPAAGAPT